MGSGSDYERARSRASQGFIPTRMPRNAAEAMGQAAGQAERDRRNAPPPSGGGSQPANSIGGYLLSLVVLFVLFMMAIHAASIIKIVPVLIGVAAFVLRKRVRGLLGHLTPLYTGAAIAMIVGSAQRVMTGSRFSLQAIVVYLAVGALIGVLYIPIAMARQPKARRRPPTRA